MSELTLIIDGRAIQARQGATILEAARSADIYIPVLCHHPGLPPAKVSRAAGAVYQGLNRIENAQPAEESSGCGLCVVELTGKDELVESCSTEALNGMDVLTDTPRVRASRRDNLVPFLARHPHACLTCSQQEGCSRTQCSSNVPESERCCWRFGRCELQDVARYVGISHATPRWRPSNLPVLNQDPLFVRDYNLCIGCTRCVRACRDLRGVEALGFVRDGLGQIQVGTLTPTLEDSGCRFCTACVEVCPTGALSDKDIRAVNRERDLVPCKEACPAHVDVPEYLRFIARGKPDEADAVVREKVPFSGTLGRICTHPCEHACRRGHVNEPVAICELKRFAADHKKDSHKGHDPGPDTGKRVAVVGAGPAGLTATFYLRKAGHRVRLYDARDLPGGMLRYGIPRHRLPLEVLEREAGVILNMGVDFNPGRILGRDLSLEDLTGKGFDAVFLGIGAWSSRKASLEGDHLQGVMGGLDFLTRAAVGRPLQPVGRVLVVGGGNAAVDAASIAVRCGARKVTMACPESREEMPARTRELDRLSADGVKLMPSRVPRRILGSRGMVTGVELVRCTAVFDTQGVFFPVLDDEAMDRLDVDQVILAIGQTPDLSFLDPGGAIQTAQGVIVVDGDTNETAMHGVYAGGDVTGAGSVVHAVASGRRAAIAIDRALGGQGDPNAPPLRTRPDSYLGPEQGFAERRREPVPELDSASRWGCFKEVALGYDQESARREASRCLQCDLRLFMGSNPSPPKLLLPLNREYSGRVPESEGVYRLLDVDNKVLAIKGTPDLRKAFMEELENNHQAALFDYEEDKMYSRRETQLIQQYVQEHGEMPGGIDDDLY